MATVLLVSVCLSLFVWLSVNESLGSSDSLLDEFSVYLSNIFERNSSKAKARRIRSSAASGFKWDESEVKPTSDQSFTEVYVPRVSSPNRSSSDDQRLQQSRVGRTSWAPIADINRLRKSAEFLFANNRNAFTNKSSKVYIQEKISDTFRRNDLLTFNQKFITTSAESTNV